MKSDTHNYLKYWRVIRYFVKRKYGLTNCDLEMLLFLYQEDIFSKKKFIGFANLLRWDRRRFQRLVDQGWIELFRERKKNIKSLYSITYKTKRLCDSIYKKLSGEEIPSSMKSNPIFAKNVSYTDTVYKNMILEMNEFIKQQRRLSPE